eukprot:g278.t1
MLKSAFSNEGALFASKSSSKGTRGAEVDLEEEDCISGQRMAEVVLEAEQMAKRVRASSVCVRRFSTSGDRGHFTSSSSSSINCRKDDVLALSKIVAAKLLAADLTSSARNLRRGSFDALTISNVEDNIEAALQLCPELEYSPLSIARAVIRLLRSFSKGESRSLDLDRVLRSELEESVTKVRSDLRRRKFREIAQSIAFVVRISRWQLPLVGLSVVLSTFCGLAAASRLHYHAAVATAARRAFESAQHRRPSSSLGSGTTTTIASAVVAMLVMSAVELLLGALRDCVVENGQTRLVLRLKREIFAAVLRQDIEWFDSGGAAAVGGATSSTNCCRRAMDAKMLADTAEHVIPRLLDVPTNTIESFARVASSAVILYRTSPHLLVLVAIVLPLKSAFEAALDAAEDHVEQMTVEAETSGVEGREIRTVWNRVLSLRDVVAVRGFASEPELLARYDRAIRGEARQRVRSGIVWKLFAPLKALSDQGADILCLWFGGVQIASGRMNPAELTVFLSMASAAFDQVKWLRASLGVLGSDVMVPVGNMLSLLRLKPRIGLGGGGEGGPTMRERGRLLAAEDAHSRRALPSFENRSRRLLRTVAEWSLEFRNVHFAYPSRATTTILNGFSARVDAGATVGFVGQSGYPVLFNCSIKENLLLGVSNAEAVDDETIKAAMKVAECYDFVFEGNRFPERWHTKVGKHGGRLSSGEKQRLACARALLRRPKLLLLDEATNALDAVCQRKVRDALAYAMRGRTVLVVAHRLSAVRNASKIFCIEGGVVKESGKHDDLLRSGGMYADNVKASQLRRCAGA